jgi:hypothetical protein
VVPCEFELRFWYLTKPKICLRNSLDGFDSNLGGFSHSQRLRRNLSTKIQPSGKVRIQSYQEGIKPLLGLLFE